MLSCPGRWQLCEFTVSFHISLRGVYIQALPQGALWHPCVNSQVFLGQNSSSPNLCRHPHTIHGLEPWVSRTCSTTPESLPCQDPPELPQGSQAESQLEYISDPPVPPVRSRAWHSPCATPSGRSCGCRSSLLIGSQRTAGDGSAFPQLVKQFSYLIINQLDLP